MTEGRGSAQVRTDVCAQACSRARVCLSCGADHPGHRQAVQAWAAHSVSSRGCGGGSAEGQGPQGRAVPRWGTHGRALLILEHNLELGLDLSWDDGREGDRHFDGAEGADLPLCVLHGKRGQSAFTFPSRRFPCPHPGPHHHHSECPWVDWACPSRTYCPASQQNPACVLVLSMTWAPCTRAHTRTHTHTPCSRPARVFSQWTLCCRSLCCSSPAQSLLGMGVAAGWLTVPAAQRLRGQTSLIQPWSSGRVFPGGGGSRSGGHACRKVACGAAGLADLSQRDLCRLLVVGYGHDSGHAHSLGFWKRRKSR